MRKTVPYLAAWFAAGVVAVAVASAGVSVVGDQVTDSRRAPLSTKQVRELAAGEEAATTTTTTVPPATTTTTAPTTSPTAGSTGAGGGPSGSTTTTTTPTPPVAVNRTYNLVGGTATLRFGPSGVTVLAAVPNAGFSVDVSQTHGSGARVEFEDDDHRSRVDGWWDGSPQDEVREDD